MKSNLKTHGFPNSLRQFDAIFARKSVVKNPTITNLREQVAIVLSI